MNELELLEIAKKYIYQEVYIAEAKSTTRVTEKLQYIKTPFDEGVRFWVDNYTSILLYDIKTQKWLPIVNNIEVELTKDEWLFFVEKIKAKNDTSLERFAYYTNKNISENILTRNLRPNTVRTLKSISAEFLNKELYEKLENYLVNYNQYIAELKK